MLSLDSILVHRSIRQKDATTQLKYKFLFILLFFLMIPHVFFLPNYLYVFDKVHWGVYLYFFMYLFILIWSIYLIRFKPSFKFSAIVASCGSFFTAFVMIYLVGGMSAPGYYWLSMSPLIFGFVFGIKWSLMGGTLAALSYILLIYFDVNKYSVNIITDPVIFEKEKIVNVFLYTLISTLVAAGFSFMANLSIRLLDKQKSFMQQLLQIVIHDLSNPISVMQSHIDLLARKYNIPKEELVALSASTKILREVISSVRSMLLASLKSMEMVKETANLHQATMNSIDFMRTFASSRDIEIVFRAQPRKYYVVGDSAIIKNQIVNNLLSNAIKYSTNGQKILVELEASRYYHTIIIQDYGIGISEEKVMNLFELRSGKSSKGLGGESGTGFGLSIVDKLVTDLGGSISVQSSTDENKSGTTFRVKLLKA